MNIFTHSDPWYEITQYVYEMVYGFLQTITNDVGSGITDFDSTCTFVTLLVMCALWLFLTIQIYKLLVWFVSKIIKIFGGF